MFPRHVPTRHRVGAHSFVLSAGAVLCALALQSIGCGGGQAEPVESQCSRIRERLVALEIPLTDPNREAHKRVMTRAMGDAFVKTCVRTTTERQRDCVFDATDSRTASACIAPSVPSSKNSLEARRTQ
jgi:hypothetical protein